MKLYISFFIAGIASISALAISSEGSLNAKTSNKEIKAPEEEIQRDGNDKIKDELISIFHSPYSEIEKFRDEVSKMDPDEKLWLEKNLEFILNGNVILYGDYNDTYDMYGSDASYNVTEDSYESISEVFDHYYNDDYGNEVWTNYVDLNDSYDAVEWALNTVQNKANDLFHHLRTKLWKNLKNDEFDELAPMTISERFRIQDDLDIRLSEALFVIIFMSIVLLVLVLFFSITIWFMRKKRKFDDEIEPILNSKPKIKFEEISCLKTKASVQEI
jgi:hypothetical protein